MDKARKTTPNARLRRERELRNWTQQHVVGGMVGVDSKLVSAWERGVKSPSAFHRQKLCELFGKSPVELGFLPEEAGKSDNQQVNRPLREQELPFPSIWNVPYEQNALFTGREQVLQQLHASLITSEPAALTQALSGLGGVGKTQIAVEYCYRHRAAYQAVLWARADSRDELLADLVSIAKLLALPESKAKDQQPILNALRRWMREQPRWLLVLDNVESIETVRDILSPTRRGHILLTTRAQATGTYPKVDVQSMDAEEGALLVRRKAESADLSGVPETDRALARQLSRELGGLPLALEQARAYIQETQCGVSDYLERFKVRRSELLSYRGASGFDYPYSVATTWSLSLERIERANATAADLLHTCAFLHPDAIPEEFFTRGAEALGPAFQPLTENTAAIDRVIAEILKYSLLRRNARDRTLAVHRLVQAVLLDNMDKERQRMWAERLVKAGNKVFLSDVTFTNLPEQRYLLQAQACMKLINEWGFTFLAAAQLISSAGKYLRSDGYYTQAADLCVRALAMFGSTPDASASDTYQCLTTLVLAKADNGDLLEAEALCERLRALAEASFGPQHHFTAFSLLYLANLYIKRGKFAPAEPLVTRALTISQSTSLPPGYPISDILLSLATLYSNQNKPTQAETLYLEALTKATQSFGAGHVKIADIHTEMANHLASYHEIEQAERSRLRALEIYREILPPDHPDIASTLTGLSLLYFLQRKYDQAEEYHKQAMEIWERKFRIVFGTSLEGATWSGGIPGEAGISPKAGGEIERLLAPEGLLGEAQGREAVATCNRLANSFLEKEQYAEAEAFFSYALHIAEKTLGREDLVTISCLGDLAKFYQQQKRFLFADFLYQRAIQLVMVKFGPVPIKFAPVETRLIFANYVQLLREMGRDRDADELQGELDEPRNMKT